MPVVSFRLRTQADFLRLLSTNVDGSHTTKECGYWRRQERGGEEKARFTSKKKEQNTQTTLTTKGFVPPYSSSSTAASICVRSCGSVELVRSRSLLLVTSVMKGVSICTVNVQSECTVLGYVEERREKSGREFSRLHSIALLWALSFFSALLLFNTHSYTYLPQGVENPRSIDDKRTTESFYQKRSNNKTECDVATRQQQERKTEPDMKQYTKGTKKKKYLRTWVMILQNI